MTKDIMFCFKEMPSNFIGIFPLWIKANLGGRMLSDVAGGLILFSDNPLQFHA